jgi:hypothetical protein
MTERLREVQLAESAAGHGGAERSEVLSTERLREVQLAESAAGHGGAERSEVLL